MAARLRIRSYLPGNLTCTGIIKVYIYIYLMMIFFAIHFLLVPQVYIFIYKPLTRLIFSYYLSTKPGCFIFHHSLKAAVMTKQTNSRAGSSWCLKMFLCLACNGTDELCPGATFETARLCVRVGCNDLGRWRDLKKLVNVYLCVPTILDSMRARNAQKPCKKCAELEGELEDARASIEAKKTQISHLLT